MLPRSSLLRSGRPILVATVCSVWAPPALQAQTGPDLISRINTHFDLASCRQFGRAGPIGEGIVGLGIAPTACNNGDVPVNWFQLPEIDHPLISNNFFRLQVIDGAARLEQIGQSWLKHGFGAAQFDECSLGCTPNPNNTRLGVGCSDPYLASQSASQCNLGPRSSVHPYTGAIEGGEWLGPGGGCKASNYNGNFPSKDHRGHAHDGISHRLQVQDVDLLPELNPDARYFGEVQYISPHEFAEGNGNQNNNVSYREYAVSGPDEGGVFFFEEIGDSISQAPAVSVWDGAQQSLVEPHPGSDGQAFLVYQATELSGGLWHYEYALYNMNLDRALASLTIPIGEDVQISNLGFHFPFHHAPELQAENYSNTHWSAVVSETSVAWSCDSFEQDPLANAVRFGTLYNFRFDADAPPAEVQASIGLFKPGAPASLSVTAVGPQPPCTGDLDDDGTVGPADLALLLGQWGADPPAPGDLNDDGQVDAADLATLLGNWGC